MIRNETFDNGVVIEAEIIDLDARTVTIEVDGVVESTRPFTDDENARADAHLQAEAEAANDTTIRTRADQALEALRTIAGSSGTLTGAQLSNAVRLLARVGIALVRLQLSKLDDTG